MPPLPGFTDFVSCWHPRAGAVGERMPCVSQIGSGHQSTTWGFAACYAERLRLSLDFLHFLSEAESAGRSACATCGTATPGCAPKIIGSRNAQM